MRCCCERYLLTRARILIVVVTALAMLAAACGSGGESSGGSPEGSVPTATEEGAALYATYCASCHGANLEGHPDWRTPNADGSYNPPPQDSTGHTWHHGDATLVQLILEGSPFRESQMPSFEEVLTVDQVLSILEFFKSNWGDQERTFQREVTERELAADS